MNKSRLKSWLLNVVGFLIMGGLLIWMTWEYPWSSKQKIITTIIATLMFVEVVYSFWHLMWWELRQWWQNRKHLWLYAPALTSREVKCVVIGLVMIVLAPCFVWAGCWIFYGVLFGNYPYLSHAALLCNSIITFVFGLLMLIYGVILVVKRDGF